MLTFYKAVLNPKTNLFEIEFNFDGNRRAKVEVDPREFLKLAEYFKKVADSYVAWTKGKEN